jgi:NAD(P)-dependent dehydrogenase (short-subunit alcohol dehydrogenase family)
MMGSLTGRVALVTGGGRGIGRSIALALAAEGARVAVTARSADEIDAVARDIRGAGGDAFAVTLDVADPEAVRRAFATVRDELGHIGVLVNNAGIGRSAVLWKTTDDQWRATIETNLSGTFYCMREALGPMVEHGWGRVINVASIAGKTGAPYIGAYSASKHGVVGLTRTAAVEVATYGVTVNAVCPGYVDTSMTDHSVATIVEKTGMDASEARRRLEAMSPQKRIVMPEEVAFLVVALTRDEARGINGQAINLDGGGVTS